MSNGSNVLDNWEDIDDASIATTLRKAKITEPSPLLTTNTGVHLTKIVTSTTLSSSSSFTTAKTTTTTTTNIVTTATVTQPVKMRLLQRPTSMPDTTATATTATSDAVVTTSSPLDNLADTLQPVLMVLHKNDAEYESANYMAAVNTQTVKILRRPAHHKEKSAATELRPKQPIKTLQQREQEYAEARLRILGAAQNIEDESVSDGTIIAVSSSMPITATEVAGAAAIKTVVTSALAAATTTTTASAVAATTTTSAINTQSLARQSLPAAQTRATTSVTTKKLAPSKNLHRTNSSSKMHYNNNTGLNQNNPYNGNYNNFYSQTTAPTLPPLTQSNFNYFYQQQYLYNNRMPTQQQLKAANSYAQHSYHNQQQQHPQQQHPQQQHYQQFHNQHQLSPAAQQLLNHLTHQRFQQQRQQQQQSWSPVVGGSVSSGVMRQPPQHIRQLQPQQAMRQHQQQHYGFNDAIWRQPRGPCPNGAMGFQIRR